MSQFEVYKKYDYRNSIGPSMYDVTRRLIYSRVSVVLSDTTQELNYVHCINALENKPKYGFDTQLGQPVFNDYWDFGKSRMVALSFMRKELHLTLLIFNTKNKGQIKKWQEHYNIWPQIRRLFDKQNVKGEMELLAESSTVGMAAFDILYGVYLRRR